MGEGTTLQASLVQQLSLDDPDGNALLGAVNATLVAVLGAGSHVAEAAGEEAAAPLLVRALDGTTAPLLRSLTPFVPQPCCQGFLL
jgi:hypothetical protein